VLRANVHNPFRGIRGINWQFSYALSRYIGSALDSDFINTAIDNNNPNAFLGPNGLDRTHQMSFGGTFDFPWNIRISTVGHVYSPLPVSLALPGGGTGGIFTSDATGDGSGDGSGVYPLGDLLPGTKIGAFGRKVKAGDLGNLISQYNATFANQATPAGQVLIQNGLFSLAQLQALGGVFPQLQAPANPNIGLGWLKTIDFRVAYPKKLYENVFLEPSVSIFNAFNMRNTDLPGNLLNGNLDGSAGSLNGALNNLGTRVGPGSGVFDLGAPRVLEFGLRLSF
jgi:hypothetical protein